MINAETIHARIREAVHRGQKDVLAGLESTLIAEAAHVQQAMLLLVKGALEQVHRREDQAITFFQQALDLYVEIGDSVGRVECLCALGVVEGKNGNNDRARVLNRQALVLAEEMNYLPGIGHTSLNLAVIDITTHTHTAETEQRLRRANSIAEQLHDTILHVGSLARLGTYYRYAGQRDSAMEALSKAMNLAIQADLPSFLVVCYNDYAALYQMHGMNPEAIDSYAKAYGYAEGLNDLRSLAIVTSNLALCHESLGNSEQVEYWANLALQHASSLNDLRLLGFNYGTLCMKNQRTGEVEKAMQYAQLSIATWEKMENHAMTIHARMLLSECMLRSGNAEGAKEQFESISPDSLVGEKMQADWLTFKVILNLGLGDYESARVSALDSLEFALKSQRPSLIRDVHGQMRDVARKLNDLDGYIKHNDEYNRIDEEIRGADVKTRIAMQEKEKEIAKEREEREREKALLYGALPKHIADRMLRGEGVSGDEHPSVSVLFMDIAGFTSHSQTLHPREVTELLDRLFDWIDKACTEHHVVKIKTIGDAYLAVAFPLSEEQQASEHATSVAHEVRITQVALQVMQHSLSWPDGSPVQVRIGLHTGAVVAGV
ncbi:MAG: hypothetical protein J5I53_10795, partial [Bradyrhizobiaceae bacterium]|nr:hypothetical protein [Bradyrhizobiaceae bacterium]